MQGYSKKELLNLILKQKGIRPPLDHFLLGPSLLCLVLALCCGGATKSFGRRKSRTCGSGATDKSALIGDIA